MLRPHAIVIRQFLMTCHSLDKVLHSLRVSFSTLSYILLCLGGSLAFFLMPDMCHKGISPIHYNLAIMTHSIKHLLLMLPNVLLMPELHF